MPLTLVTGPVRSGKSRFAERLAYDAAQPVVYVATARPDPDDAEWRERLAHHAARRPSTWRIVETAVAGAPSLDALVARTEAGTTLVIDSLGTWLADRMSARLADGGDAAAVDAAALEREGVQLAQALVAARAHAIVVGEEVGWGIVPAFAAGRAFRDVLGRLQQRLAAGADAVYLVVAGFAVDLRDVGRVVEDVPSD